MIRVVGNAPQPYSNRDSSMKTRPFSFLLSALAVSTALVSAPFVGDVPAQTTELREGQSVRGTLAEGDTARYSVEVEKDYFLYGEVNQISVNVIVRIHGADGSRRRGFNGPTRGPERFTGQTTEPGVYTIVVIPSRKRPVTMKLHSIGWSPSRPTGGSSRTSSCPPSTMTTRQVRRCRFGETDERCFRRLTAWRISPTKSA